MSFLTQLTATQYHRDTITHFPPSLTGNLEYEFISDAVECSILVEYTLGDEIVDVDGETT